MRRSPLRILLTLAAIAVIAAVRYMQDDAKAPRTESPSAAQAPAGAPAPRPEPPSAQREISTSRSAPRAGNGAIVEAYRQRKSDVWLEGSGTVEALLPDDRQGSKHQKFIVRVDRDLTILVSHNIDLAPRVPIDKGDAVTFRGEYVWNSKGGLVHWTHRDPRGRRGGWIRLGDEVYE
jgi:hypothetical protein